MLALIAVVAAAVGVLGRDRGQFVFAVYFAWLAIGQWQLISASLPPELASSVWGGRFWETVWNALFLLAAAILLQARERAPRQYRWMIAAGVLFLSYNLVPTIDHSDALHRAIFSSLLVLVWVVGIAASWRVWRLGHRVGAVGLVLFAIDAAVFGAGSVASIVNYFVPIDVQPFGFGEWGNVLATVSFPLVFTAAVILRGLEQLRISQRLREGPCRSRGGERGQERVSGDDEPRNSHTDERHHRHERPAAEQQARQRPARTDDHDSRLGDALLAVINDILDFSKIEAGRMEVETAPFVLRECVDSALALVRPRAAEKGLQLTSTLDDDVPPQSPAT